MVTILVNVEIVEKSINNKKCCDSIKLTINLMVKHSKYKDIKINKYDANNFINFCFIKLLIEKLTKCFYCEIQM
jgi:hypothetical protein